MTGHKPLIRVTGSLNIDFVTTTPRVPAAGETLTATSLSVNAGGKGANQAVGCGKAAYLSRDGEPGVKVQMVGAVGKGDPYYESLLKPSLERSGVEMQFVQEVEDTQTGTATILVDEGAGGENRILVVPGANDVGMKDLGSLLEVVEAGEGRVEPDVVVMQGEIPRSTVLGLLEHYNAADSRTKVVFNPAPVFPDGIPLCALKNLAVLVVNETECVLLARSLKKSGATESIPLGAESEDLDVSTCKAFAELFHSIAQIEIVLITLGAKGVFFSSSSSKDRTQELVSGVKVKKVVDTTAAGDTFVGYFATALARHAAAQNSGSFDVASAVKQANAAAALCVQKAGAMQSIPFAYELDM